MEEQLWLACKDGMIEDVRKLLQSSEINPNHQFYYDQTPFYVACQNGHTDIVKLLLNDQRVDINKANKSGWTPFYIACSFGHTEIVKLLWNDQRVDVNHTSEYGTPFYVACFYGNIEIVKLLLNYQRIDVNKADAYGKIPFYVACFYGNIEIIEYILANGRGVNVSIKDIKGETAIDIARRRGNEEKRDWGENEEESEEKFQERKRRYGKIVELLESFKRNPIETRLKLRLKLELAGKIQFYFIDN